MQGDSLVTLLIYLIKHSFANKIFTLTMFDPVPGFILNTLGEGIVTQTRVERAAFYPGL